MAARGTTYSIRRMICDMVRRGAGVDQIQMRLSGETDESNLRYASSLVRVRDELLAAKLKSASA